MSSRKATAHTCRTGLPRARYSTDRGTERPERGPAGGHLRRASLARKLLAGALLAAAVSACKKPAEAARTDAKRASPSGLQEAGCERGGDRDLDQVANCFYLGHPADPWHFLSRESRPEAGTRDDFNKAFAQPSDWRTNSATVLGVESRDGQVFGRVQVVYEAAVKGRKACSEVRTKTWAQEDGAWRRVVRRHEEELADKQFQNGDYSGSVATAEKWLRLDPFSVEAYKRLVFALARDESGSSNGRSLPDTLQAALALDPADSVALFLAVTFTEDPDEGETLFGKLAPDDCIREQAAFNLALRMSPERRLAFLEKLGSTSPRIQMQLVQGLVQLGDSERLRALLTPDLDKAIRTQLEQQDGSNAALWSLTMGEAWLLLENRDAAKAWASYAGTRDPNQPGIADLLRRVKE